MCLGVFHYANSESAVRIEKGRTVRKIWHPEILPVKLSRTGLLTDPGIVLDADSESVVAILKFCIVPEIFTF